MNKTLLAIPLIAGAIAAAGCGSSSSPSSEATNPATNTTGADASRQAAATPDIGPGALKVVNKATRLLQLKVTGVDNYDWANDNRPDHEPPQGINKVILPVGGSVLAARLDHNMNAKIEPPFNVEFNILNLDRTTVAGIRLAICSLEKPPRSATGVQGACNVGQRDYPQAGDYVLRVAVPEDPKWGGPGGPTVLTITRKSNPTW
ncbi:MAG: hypothetical protein ACKORG_07650 [Actinomycetota bacterium]